MNDETSSNAPNAPKAATSPVSARMSSKTKTASMKKGGKSELTPKLRFPEFREAEGWETHELGPMTRKVGSGVTPKGGEKKYKMKGRPFVRSQNVGWGHLILDDVAFIDEETHSSFDSTEIKRSDVLLNITGASIGRSAIADSRIEKGNVNQHVCIIRVKQTELNPVLLNQYLISPFGQKQIDSFQAGGNRQGLNFAQIRSFLIPLPPSVNEQQKIAEFLTTLDEVIAAQSQKLDALKTFKKGLMQQLFPRKGENLPRIRFPEFQNAGEWKGTNLAAVARLRNGYAFRSSEYVDSGPYQIITIANVQQGMITLESTKKISGLPSDIQDHQILHIGDVLISMTGNVGRVCRVPLEGLLLNQRVGKLVPETINQAFFYHSLQRDEFRNTMQLKAAGGAQGNLSAGDITEYALSVPDTADEQHRIADCLSSLDDLIAAHTQKLKALKTHKNGLMQQLFPYPEDHL